jgi:hypothetical protein
MKTVAWLCRFIGWDGLTALATAALATIGYRAATYARTQIDEFRREAKVGHLIELVNEFEREPMSGWRKRLAVDRLKNGRLRPLDIENPPTALHTVMNFFEHMGILLEGGYLELGGVSSEFHYWIFRIWADGSSVIAHEQRETPVYYQSFEKMKSRLEEFELSQGRAIEAPSSEEIESFYREEADLPSGTPLARRSTRRPK